MGQSTDTDNLVENIGRKIPYCNECQTSSFEEPTPIVEIVGPKGKVTKHCPFCGDKLVMRSRDRVDKYVERPVLFSELNAPRSSVTRYFSSPWGRVKAHISVHSYFAPFVELNDVPNAAIKRLIDEEFVIGAIMTSMTELGVGEGLHEQIKYSVFVTTLHRLVAQIHLDPFAVPELDMELAA